MVQRYFKLKPFFARFEGSQYASELGPLFLSYHEERELLELSKHMEDLHSVTKKLQEENLTADEVRTLFDGGWALFSHHIFRFFLYYP
jgi:hypothetical protein